MNEIFRAEIKWLPKGKKFTLEEYSREYTINSDGKPEIIGTAGVSFKGSPHHYSPEDLLVAALSSCHMLSYLHFAASHKIIVLEYHDNADGLLHTKEGKICFKEVTLRPKVVISAEGNQEKALALHEKAHQQCFIANSVNFKVHVEPQITT